MNKRLGSFLLVCTALVAMLVRCFWFSGLPSEQQLRSSISRHEHTASDLTAWLQANHYLHTVRHRQSSPEMERFGIPPTVDTPELRDAGFSQDQIAAGDTAIWFQIQTAPIFAPGTPYLMGNYVYDASGKLIVGRATSICFGL